MFDLEKLFESSEASAKEFQNLTDGVAGISAQRWEAHLDLYRNYVKTIRQIQDSLQDADPKSVKSADGGFSMFAELRRRQPAMLNAVRLHELFFEGLSLAPTTFDDLPEANSVRAAIEESYGSKEAWAQEMIASIRVAHGWTLFGWDHYAQMWRIFDMESHAEGGIIGICPVIIVDAYEHAYFGELSKDEYSKQVVLGALDWSVAEGRFHQVPFEKRAH